MNELIKRIYLVSLSCLFLLTRQSQAQPSTTTAAIEKNNETSLVLTQEIVELARVAAELNHALVVSNNPDSEGYDTFTFYNGVPDGFPDQAIVAKKGNHCFLAFRATTLNVADFYQNFNPFFETVCSVNDETNCCSVKQGYWQAYYLPPFREAMEEEIRSCAQEVCTEANRDTCVVLTGWSAGGSIAIVAGLYLKDLDPLGITFGATPALRLPCDDDLLQTHRWIRLVNSISTGRLFDNPIEYDGAVGPWGADLFGHHVILSNDPTSVAYIGLDSQEYFRPVAFPAHAMGVDTPLVGYWDRILAIQEAYSSSTELDYPVRLNGYRDGFPCSRDIECQSGYCRRKHCRSA